jgi:hypothetical protein
MRFLFVARQSALRVFEAPIRTLCEGGDEVLVLVEAPRQIPHVMERLEAIQGLTIRFVEPELKNSREIALGTAIREWINYLRYLEPDVAAATKYREQRARRLPERLREDIDRAASGSPEVRLALSAGLRALERTVPIPAEVMRQLQRDRPDAVLVSPLVARASCQPFYVRAARRVGIPSALSVASWDNLPAKGFMSDVPDLVTVWNDAQREEAVRLHGVPPERIAVTGAPRFDEWFDLGPTASREEYCGRLGLPSDRPHILYVGSSLFKRDRHEGEWISRWVSRLRQSGHSELRDVPVVVRPHPKKPLDGDSKGAQQLARTPGVVLHPPHGRLVVDEEALSEYFDSLYHAAVVVGLNTSAMVEAAVVGRGVHVLLVKAYRAIQQDSPHFNHLRSVGGGLIVTTKSMEEHAAGLARALRGDDSQEAADRARSFLASFIRPHGLDRPATPIMVDSLRNLTARDGVDAEPEMEDLAEALRPMLLPERSSRKARKRGGVRSETARARGQAKAKGQRKRGQRRSPTSPKAGSQQPAQ